MDYKNLLAAATGVTCDSRQVSPGYIFVAICGHQLDGNAFAAAAVARGAAAVVSDAPGRLPPLPVPVAAVADARAALAELAAAFYGHPSRALALTGVTGTNGKTTVACMIEHIFRQAGLTTGLIGTLGVRVGQAAIPGSLTTPDAATLQACLATMRDCGVSHAAMEVSAQGLALRRAAAVQFSCGVLTNISADHLDFPGGLAAYLAAKEAFPSLLPGEAPLVVPLDDPRCPAVMAGARGPVVTAALEGEADVTARILRLTATDSRFAVTVRRELPGVTGRAVAPGTFIAGLMPPGRHNVANGLLAATAALLHGLAPDVVAQGLTSFPGVPRRMTVTRLGGLTVVDDTALNPASLDAVFMTMAVFPRRLLVVVNAIRGGRGPAINAANAEALARWWSNEPFRLVVTAAADCVGPADTVSDQEKSAFLQALDDEGVVYSYQDTLAAATAAAYAAARPGDLVTLLGAQGMDNGLALFSRLATGEAAKRQELPEAAAGGGYLT